MWASLSALKAQCRLAGGVLSGNCLQPDLAGAAAHAIVFYFGALGQAGQSASKLNYVAIALLPIVDQGEVFYNVVNAGRCIAHGLHIWARVLLAPEKFAFE